MPVSPIRKQDLIGQAIQNAFTQFGQSLGKGYQQGQEQAEQAGIVQNLLNRQNTAPNLTLYSEQNIPLMQGLNDRNLGIIKSLADYQAEQEKAGRPKFETVRPGDTYGSVGGDGVFREQGSIPETPKEKEPSKLSFANIVGVGADGSPHNVRIGSDPFTGQIKSREDLGPAYRSSVSQLPEAVQVNLINRFNSDPNVRKAQQMVDATSTIIDLIDSKNPVAASSIPTFMARASGEVGNLSEADKAPFGGSQALAERISQVATTAASGQLTPENAQFVRELADLMQKRAMQNMDGIARKRAKQYSRANKKLDENELYLMFNPSAEVDEIDLRIQEIEQALEEE